MSSPRSGRGLRAAAARTLILGVGVGACLHPSDPGPLAPTGDARVAAPHGAARTHRVTELRFDLGALAASHPDDVELRARFTTPGGRVVEVDGFADRGTFAVRFTPEEAGLHRWEASARDGDRERSLGAGRFVAEASGLPGFVRARPKSRALTYADGTVFHPLGTNRFNLYDPTWNHDALSGPEFVAYMAEHGLNTLRMFIIADCEAEELPDGRQPGCLEPQVGRFDPEVAERFDAIFEAAEAHGVYVIPTLFAVGFTEGETWKSWDDNPYNAKLGGPVATPEAFFTDPAARAAAVKRLRYVLARWGASPSFLAIDLLNEPEWDGGIREELWIPWARALADTWRARDPYGHPITAGPVGLHWNIDGDERPWWSSPQNDIVQWHLYGKEIYDVHDLARTMTANVRETWSDEKPVLIGEFAYGGEDPAHFDHTHVGIWAATFSGAGVLAHSAPPFNIDSDLPLSPERARRFSILRDFLAQVPTRRPLLPNSRAKSARNGATVWMLENAEAGALWIMAPKAGYGRPVEGLRVHLLPGGAMPRGPVDVRFVDDHTGETVATRALEVGPEGATLEVPPFTRHLAAILTPRSPELASSEAR